MTEYINVKSRGKKEDELFRIFKSALKRRNISMTDAVITSMIFIVEFYEKSKLQESFDISPKVSEIFEKYKKFGDSGPKEQTLKFSNE
jgi:hypothetical protein